MKYNVGDKVRIKSIDWYNENKDEDGIVELSTHVFIPEMVEHCGTVVTIKDVFEDIDDNVVYYMKEIDWDWTNEMIEGCVESIEDGLKELRKMCTISLTDDNYTDKVEVLLNDYEYIEENGKAFFVKKKKYPKTYEECCKIMDCAVHPYITANEPGIVSYYEDDLNFKILSLRKLRICRDAYWKIAGDEMGFGKPWEPDWREERYIIYRNQDDIIGGYRKAGCVEHHIFEFPTAEMRDAFKENFDPDIEICKEFL